jgi:hypothetical protein
MIDLMGVVAEWQGRDDEKYWIVLPRHFKSLLLYDHLALLHREPILPHMIVGRWVQRYISIYNTNTKHEYLHDLEWLEWTDYTDGGYDHSVP